MRTALVIPSNRETRLQEFLHAWKKDGDWDEVVVIEDAPERSFKLDSRWPLTQISHAEAELILRGDAWIISRGDSACRALGFLVAAERGADWILTLDDDCRPMRSDYVRELDAWTTRTGPICAAHLAATKSHTVCQPTAGIRTRGLPYRNLGTVESHLNMGLWYNVPDVDGPSGLTPQPYFAPPAGNELAHPNCRYPLCGMNLFFHRSLLPALYFPLMGAGQPYSRFDDIWAGWIFQRVAQHLSIPWSFGEPFIDHLRASDPFANLEKEAPGIRPNETLWERINTIELTAAGIHGTVGQLARAIGTDADPYFSRLGHALARWNQHAARVCAVDCTPSR